MIVLLLDLGLKMSYILEVIFLNIGILFSGYFNLMKIYLVIRYFKKKRSPKKLKEIEVFMAIGVKYNCSENSSKIWVLMEKKYRSSNKLWI